jgi:putative SOS response-associated peptidase YedK
MCYNVTSKLGSKDIEKLAQDLQVIIDLDEVRDYYSVSGFAHTTLPVITAEKRLTAYRWGLIPPWTKDWDKAKVLRSQCLNCIGEEMEGKPSFRGAVKNQQFCIIPLNGFYEWHHYGDQKYPHYIYPKNDKLFYVAGIYEQWTNKAIDEVHNTFSIVTVAANERMSWIHNVKKRMPNILSLDEAKMWIDSGISFAEKKKLIKPYDQDLMADHPVSRLITSRKPGDNPNSPAVYEKFEYPELALL